MFMRATGAVCVWLVTWHEGPRTPGRTTPHCSGARGPGRSKVLRLQWTRRFRSLPASMQAFQRNWSSQHDTQTARTAALNARVAGSCTAPIGVMRLEPASAAGSGGRCRMCGIDHAYHPQADTGVTDVRIGSALASERRLAAAIAPGKSAKHARARAAAFQPLAVVAVQIEGTHAARGVPPDRRGLCSAVIAGQTVVVHGALTAHVIDVAEPAWVVFRHAVCGAQPFVGAG